MKMKFAGTYAELQDKLFLTGIDGEWRNLGNHKQFRADTGAILNWWQSTGTITFQGRGLVAEEFKAKLSRAIGGVKCKAGNLHDSQQENAKLKKLLGDVMIENAMLKKRLSSNNKD